MNLQRVPVLFEQLQRLRSCTERGHVYVYGRHRVERRSYAQISEHAGLLSGALARRGVVRGDRVGILLSNNESFVATFLACAHGGYVAVPLSPPLTLGRIEHFVQRLDAITRTAELKLLVSDEHDRLGWSALAHATPALNVVSFPELRASGCEHPPADLTPESIAFLQFTSGSTGVPKGVVIDYGNLAANCSAIMLEGLDVAPDDVGISWLPLFHDMGLVGHVLAPFCTGTNAVLLPTASFVKNPSVWMTAMAEYGGTITFAPNFAFAMAARRLRTGPSARDLSQVRVVGCGAEPIRAESLRDFIRAYAPFGLRAAAIMPCYGMAEATLAVSFADSAEPPRSLHVERHSCDPGAAAIACTAASGGDAVELVSCGRPFRGYDVAAVDQFGTPLSEGRVGELVIRGPSVARGYYRNGDAEQQSFRDGTLHSGDLGFFRDGELYVCGRIKDLIIVHGANHHAHDIEWAVEHVDGVRIGNVAAIAVDSGEGERLVIVCEPARTLTGGALRETIRREVGARCGILPWDIALAPPGTLPKTTSGKIQRGAVRRRYLAGQYEGEKRSLGRQSDARADATVNGDCDDAL